MPSARSQTFILTPCTFGVIHSTKTIHFLFPNPFPFYQGLSLLSYLVCLILNFKASS